MDINFELYKIFYHVVKAGSFSAAAEKLYVSQSAVSQAVKNLEDRMGETLFYRKTRNIRLTREGEVLFGHIEQAYNYIKAGENRILEMKNLEAGDTVCKYFMVPYMEKFIQVHPKIKIQVVNRTSSQIINLLKGGIIEIGIVTMPALDEDIETEEFMTVEDVFVASYRYSGLKGRTVTLQELSEYPVLMLQRNSATRRNFDMQLNSMGISITPEIELESIELMVEFAKIGLGISHVLKESAIEAINKDELFVIETKEALPLRRLGIASLKGAPLSNASTKFIDLIRRGHTQ